MLVLISKQFYVRLSALMFAVTVVFLVTSSSVYGANVVIQNADAPNIGFNDPTPVSPVGANTGTTLGQQRIDCPSACGKHLGRNTSERTNHHDSRNLGSR